MGANLATLFKLRKPQRQPWDETLPDGTPAIDAAADSTDVQPARPKLLQFLRPVQPVPDETVSEQVTPDAQPTLAQRYGVTPDSGQSTDPLYKPVQPVPTIAQRFQVDPRQAAITKRDTLLADRNPKDTNGRGKSALKAMLDGAIAGLRTGGIGGALGGAAEGAIHGAAAPNLDERRTRNQEINRLSGGIALTDAENKRALEQKQGVAALNETVAKTNALNNPKPNYQLKDAEGGGVVAVDLNNPNAQPMKIPGVQGAAADYEIHDDGTSVTAINRHNPRDRFALDGLKPKPRPQMVSRTLSDGTVVQVPASAALSSDSAVTAANIQADAQGGANVVTAANENADREYQTKFSAWKLEGDRVSDYNGLRDKRAEAERRFNAAQKILLSTDPGTLTDAKDKANYAERQAEFESLGGELNDLNKQEQAARESLNPEYVEFRPDGHARQKPQPTQPKIQAKPGPAKRTSGTVQSVPKSKDPLGLYN